MTTSEPILVHNPVQLPSQIEAMRMPMGEVGDYKPCLAKLPTGELWLIGFVGSFDPSVTREDIFLYKSEDDGHTWSEREYLPILGREPWLSITSNGVVFVTTHMLTREDRNELGCTYSYLHWTDNEARTWDTLRISGEDVPGAAPDAWTHTSRNVLELDDGTLLLGVSAAQVPRDYLWRSNDGGKTWDRSIYCDYAGEGIDRSNVSIPFMAETMFHQTPNGDLHALFRVDQASVRPIEGRNPPDETSDQFERLAHFRSRDSGRHWHLEPEIGSTYGEMYPSLLSLDNDRLLLTFTVRELHPPLGARAIVGRQVGDGFSFDFQRDRLMIDVKSPVGLSSGGGFGPTVQTTAGDLLTAYSYRGPDDKVRIELARWRL